MYSELCIYHLFVFSNLNFLHNSQWFSSPPIRVLYLFVLICCIRLVCKCSFRLCDYITDICNFVASYLFLLYDFYSLRVFQISVSWWFSTEVWETPSLFKSPGLFSVFWRSQKCFLHPSRYFQVLQSLYQSFSDCTKSTKYNWYNRHFHVPQFFQFPSKVVVFIFLFTFFQFYSVVSRDSSDNNSASSFFFIDYYKVWSSGWDLVIRLYLKIRDEFMWVFFSWIDSGFCIIIIRVFHISISWWSFTEVWVTASLLKSPGLFSVFWPFSIM